ncbi:MAG: hypothetical protein ACFFDF_04265 [Candidatus Odinarchaeota archaeon]
MNVHANAFLNLVSLFLGFLFLDIIGLFSFLKLPNKLKLDNFSPEIKSVLNKKYYSFSIFTEIVGLVILITSFYLPWYYYLPGDGYLRQNLYLLDAANSLEIINILIYYTYIIGLILIFIKVSIRRNLNSLNIFELIELIFFIPGTIIIFITKFDLGMWWALWNYSNSGYTSGFILYIIGLVILIANGLQISTYLRLKRKQNKPKNI